MLHGVGGCLGPIIDSQLRKDARNIVPDRPFAQEQGIGAYAILGAILFWKGRRPFVEGWRALAGRVYGRRAADETALRWPLIGALAGFIGAVIFCRAAGMTYSRFIDGLKKAGVAIDRKCLADLAATDAAAFGKLIEVARAKA